MGIFYFPLINQCCLEECLGRTTLLLLLPSGILSSQSLLGSNLPSFRKVLKNWLFKQTRSQVICDPDWQRTDDWYLSILLIHNHHQLLCMFYMFLKNIYVCCLEFSDQVAYKSKPINNKEHTLQPHVSFFFSPLLERFDGTRKTVFQKEIWSNF